MKKLFLFSLCLASLCYTPFGFGVWPEVEGTSAMSEVQADRVAALKPQSESFWNSYGWGRSNTRNTALAGAGTALGIEVTRRAVKKFQALKKELAVVRGEIRANPKDAKLRTKRLQIILKLIGLVAGGGVAAAGGVYSLVHLFKNLRDNEYLRRGSIPDFDGENAFWLNSDWLKTHVNDYVAVEDRLSRENTTKRTNEEARMARENPVVVPGLNQRGGVQPSDVARNRLGTLEPYWEAQKRLALITHIRKNARKGSLNKKTSAALNKLWQQHSHDRVKGEQGLFDLSREDDYLNYKKPWYNPL